jgi:hypothetical protein
MLLITMFGMAIGLLVAWKKTREVSRRLELLDLLEQDVLPMVKIMHGLFEDAAPRLQDASNQIMVMSHTAREQVEAMNKSVMDVIERTHAQAKRADQSLSIILDWVDSSTRSVQRATKDTSRQVTAIAKGVRAGIERLQRKTAA